MKKLYLVIPPLLMSTQLALAQTSPIQAALAVNRTSGVAPLTVFFVSSATTATATSRPFHDLEYRWNFGDGAATWQRGARSGASSKNTATGAIAAHVYENPGTYTAKVSVFDGVNTTTRQVTFTVTNPNTVYSGTNTVCFSTGVKGFYGCPTGAQQVKTADYAWAVNTYKAPGKRLLFRRGEIFRSANSANINVSGPGTIGAFGPTTDPIPVLQASAAVNIFTLSSNRTPTLSDWRIMDLNLVGTGAASSYGVAMGGGINQVTLLRLSAQRQRIAFIADYAVLDWYNASSSTAGHRIWDQLAVVDSTITGVNHGTGGNIGYGTYIAADRAFYSGNYVDVAGTATADVSHAARFPYLGKSVVSNNTLMRPGPNEHAIKLHAPKWGVASVTQSGIGRGYSRWVEIADNKFVGAYNPWLIAVGPQNAQNDERVRDVVSERNWFVAGPGTQVSQIFFASEVTSRNNIVDASAGPSWQTGIQVARRGIEPYPANIRIFNDAYYSSKALPNGQFLGINLSSGVTYVTARNNVGYAPNATNPQMVRNSCGTCLVQSNNSTNTQVKSNLPFVTSTPTGPSGFKAAGYTIGSGAATPTWSDFFTANRNSPRDIGAAVH